MENTFIPILITNKALEEVRIIMNSKEVPDDYGLRIGVRGTGCGSTGHILGFDHKKENDLEFMRNDVPVYIQKKDVLYMVGYELDFVEREDASGFAFKKIDQNEDNQEVIKS
jgi:iron-sulfur cluster assembly protein